MNFGNYRKNDGKNQNYNSSYDSSEPRWTIYEFSSWNRWLCKLFLWKCSIPIRKSGCVPLRTHTMTHRYYLIRSRTDIPFILIQSLNRNRMRPSDSAKYCQKQSFNRKSIHWRTERENLGSSMQFVDVSGRHKNHLRNWILATSLKNSGESRKLRFSKYTDRHLSKHLDSGSDDKVKEVR